MIFYENNSTAHMGIASSLLRTYYYHIVLSLSGKSSFLLVLLKFRLRLKCVYIYLYQYIRMAFYKKWSLLFCWAQLRFCLCWTGFGLITKIKTTNVSVENLGKQYMTLLLLSFSFVSLKEELILSCSVFSLLAEISLRFRCTYFKCDCKTEKVAHI